MPLNDNHIRDCRCDCPESQEELHKDLTWEEFLALPQAERDDDTIYFIQDKGSISELIKGLTTVLEEVKNELRKEG